MFGRSSRRRRRGVALLEVLVALVIITTAGASVAALASETARAMSHSRDSEAEIERARAFFEEVTLWPRDDLDRHLGNREQGPWRLDVEHIAPALYSLMLTDSSGSRALLRTVVFRPEVAHDTL
jgi:type II secretory pathway component PulK